MTAIRGKDNDHETTKPFNTGSVFSRVSNLADPVRLTTHETPLAYEPGHELLWRQFQSERGRNLHGQWPQPGGPHQCFSAVSPVTMAAPGEDDTIIVDPSVTVRSPSSPGRAAASPARLPTRAICGWTAPLHCRRSDCSLTLQAGVSDGAISDWHVDLGRWNLNGTFSTSSA